MDEAAAWRVLASASVVDEAQRERLARREQSAAVASGSPAGGFAAPH